jgi:hypothetical protein
VSEIEKLSGDALVAPAWILPCPTQHGLAKARGDGWTALGAVRVGPASGNQFSVPAQQRRRSREEYVPEGTTQHPGQHGEQDSIGRLKIRSVDLTA